MPAQTMLDQYPAEITLDRTQLAEAIEAAVECAQACTACADACLSEQNVSELTRCIRDNLDCADICDTTGRVLSRHTGYDAGLTSAQLRACIEACRTCGDSCEEHADHMDHCRTCAESCHRCEQLCSQLLDAISRTGGEEPSSPSDAAPQA
jgi:hypothetical protein